MSTTTMVSESQTPPNRAGRLRRLSQLRAYTQSHLIPSSSSSASSTAATSPPSAGNQRRHRNSLSRVVYLSSPVHISTAADSIQPLAASASSLSPEREVHQTDNGTSSDSDPRDQSASSASSRSLPSSHEGSAQAADSGVQTMAVDNYAPHNGQDSSTPAATTDASINTDNNNSSAANKKPKMNNTIRFFAYQDTHHSSRPSLQFSPMTRTLPSEDCIIRVGRYSERDGVPIANPSEPSDAPIGFKSKVVSRKHCEFSMVNGQWHIKDVGSSSGTFLNRTRLSQPNMVSRLYAVRDGDIIQLGIDFRGGEEMIFRCVRIRVECNRTWQQRPNEFNKNTESLINNLGKGKAASNFEGCRECSICLGSVLRPYQCLFMAACAHVWHYKCIRRLIHTPDYPMFQCPNCRAWTDLSAEVDDSMEFDEESAKEEADITEIKPDDAGEGSRDATNEADANGPGEQPPATVQANGENTTNDRELAAIAENLHLEEERNTSTQDAENSDGANITSKGPVSSNSQSANIPIPNGSSSHGNSSNSRSDTPANHETFEDDPMTPRNDTGPLALDGRAGHL